MSLPILLTMEQRLRQIKLAYAVFLRENRLQDTMVTRMTYLWGIKKEYLADPLPLEEDQQIVLDNLDASMAETLRLMEQKMAPTSY